MSTFHVNPATGNPGECKARWECPFGEADVHFTTSAEARSFFEGTQETFLKPQKKAKIYRVGSLAPMEKHFDELQGFLKDFEEVTPEDRPNRSNSLFASPDLQSHGRWVLGVRNIRGVDSTSHELTVDPNSVYIYPIELYEVASNHHSWGRMDEFRAAAKEYWDSGMTLADWKSWSAKAKPKPGTWEILVPPTAELNPKPVSNRRIIENSTENWHRALSFELEPSRASKGLTWPRKDESDSDLTSNS